MKLNEKDAAYFFDLETSLHKSEIRKSPEAAAALHRIALTQAIRLGLQLYDRECNGLITPVTDSVRPATPTLLRF